MRSLLLLAVLASAGCVSDAARADIAASAMASYNAAASLPPSPQTTAIELNQLAIAKAVGVPFDPQPPTAPAAGATP